MKRPVTYRSRFTFVYKPTKAEINVDISGESPQMVAYVTNMLKDKVKEKEPEDMEIPTVFADSEKRWYDFLKWWWSRP
jgi:hypothetical protein